MKEKLMILLNVDETQVDRRVTSKQLTTRQRIFDSLKYNFYRSN